MAELASMRPCVVVADDDPDQCALLQRWLEKDGNATVVFHDGESCIRGMSQVVPDAVCLDLNMPGIGGLETLERLKARHPQLPVLILTSEGGVQSVVEAMRRGAHDYITKPVDRTRLLTSLHNAVQHHRMAVRLVQLTHEVEGWSDRGILTESSAMKELLRQVDRVAPTDVAVLIHGESGTGKELLARAVHLGSPRRNGPFVAVNCAAIPAALIESELFGHERGAFTGASQRRIGRIEQADRGTLFLDEIGELNPDLQAKLLRVLQEGTFHRVGAAEETRSDFRLLTATHRDLRADIEMQRFREDLFFRVAVYELDVPPLREREGDVVLLAETFARQYGEKHRGGAARLVPETLSVLAAYAWPGNVRELQNAVQRAIVSSDGPDIRPRDLPPHVRRSHKGPAAKGEAPAAAADQPLASLNLADLEKRAIEQALARTNRNLAKTARILGIGRTTLYRKLKDYHLG